VRIKNIPPPVEETPAAEEAPAATEASAEPTTEGSAEAPAAE
jgi:hypothetical protein